MKKSRKILFISLLAICIVAINVGVYLQFFKVDSKEKREEETIKLENAIKEFDTIFRNEFNAQNNSVSNTIKKNKDKAIVYAKIKKQEAKQNEYNINVNIPIINIDDKIIEEYNKKIENIFETKLNSILSEKQSNTIYTVEYQGYLNSNILSLIIKATLKEGNYPQRVIVQTYNYNISTNQEVNLNELIKIKGLTQSKVTESINKRIQDENKQAEQLQELTGQSVYSRDINSDIYKIENTNTYLLGENNILYILYPYGNSNYTSELDIVAF